MGGLRRLCKLVAEAMWLVVEAMCWVDNYSINNTTSCPILQAEAIQIFSYAEISRWTKCGKKGNVTSSGQRKLCTHRLLPPCGHF